MASASQPASSPRASELSPAEHALGVPLIAERIAHFVLQQQPTPEELARVEQGFNGALRAALTPHWEELCCALSPGVVAFREHEREEPPYRRLYWQLRAMAEQRPLMPRARYTFVADVVFHSGEHVSTWSGAFNWPEDVEAARFAVGGGRWHKYAYELGLAQQKRPKRFLFTAGDLQIGSEEPHESVTATLHVLRNDGAIARLQMMYDGALLLHPDPFYDEGEEINDPLELRFDGYLSSNESYGDHGADAEVQLSLYLGQCDDEPLVYYRNDREWTEQCNRRFKIMQDRHLPDELQTVLTVGDASDAAELAKSVTCSLDRLAWVLPS